MYFTEFSHWLDGGKLLHKDEFGNWENTRDIWDLRTERIKAVVINDEYVEFRKALAEGKTLQMYCKYDSIPPIWDDMTETIKSIGFVIPKENYRVKPEELNRN